LTRSTNDSHEIISIVTRAPKGKLKDIDVRVVTAWYVVQWFQKCWIVVSALIFLPTLHWAVNLTALPAAVSDHSIPAHKTWAIRCCEEKLEARFKCAVFGRIPDVEAFMLKCCDVMESYK